MEKENLKGQVGRISIKETTRRLRVDTLSQEVQDVLLGGGKKRKSRTKELEHRQVPHKDRLKPLFEEKIKEIRQYFINHPKEIKYTIELWTTFGDTGHNYTKFTNNIRNIVGEQDYYREYFQVWRYFVDLVKDQLSKEAELPDAIPDENGFEAQEIRLVIPRPATL